MPLLGVMHIWYNNPLLKVNKMYSVKLFLFFSILVSFSSSADFESKAKKVNPNPLSISPIGIELQTPNKGFVTVQLDLAPKHKAYFDVFKVESSIQDKLSFSSPEVDPLESFIDKFNQKKERLAFEGQGTLRFFVSSSSRLPSALNLKLNYQACTNDYCLLPKKINFTIDVPIKDELSDDGHGHDKGFIARIKRDLGKASFLSFLLIYILGFLTSLTPCIYPIIPLTVGVLGINKSTSRSRGFTVGTCYAVGMSLVYASLGVVSALTGGFIGKTLTNPYVVWGVFIFYVFMAISMFGFFEVKAPNFVGKRFGRLQVRGPFGALFAGLIAGLVASPCVGPVVASILTYTAQSQSAFYGFTALFSFGMGLGTLFILMGVFYGELSSRLKAGKWVLYVKYLLGILLLGGAFLFIKPHLSFFKGIGDHDQGPWKTWSRPMLKEAKSANQAVIIDFYADWCVSCVELEEQVFALDQFKEATKDFLLLRFDATESDEEKEKVLQSYKVIGLPTIIFIDGNGKVLEDLTLTGFEEWPQFIKRVDHLKGRK